MTAPKYPPFPASLTMPDDLRRPLLRLTTDGRARIVYDVRDAAQPMAHVAVLLTGRRLVGWVIATGWEDDKIETPGAVCAETIEALVPCGDTSNPLRHIGGSTHLPALVIRRTMCGTPDDQGYATEVRRTQWQRFVCEELTRATGMVEVLHADRLPGAAVWQRTGVLMPDNKGEWMCVREDMAARLARAELGVPLHDNVVSRHDWVPVTTPAGAGHLKLDSASDAVRLEGTPRVNLRGLTAITLEGVPNVTLEARRSFKVFAWSVSLDARVPGRPDRIYAFQVYPRTVDGADAFSLLKEIARTFTMPEAVPPDAEATPAAQRAFAELLADVWNRRRRLQFVLDGLGITDTVQPPRFEAAVTP
jgi:hypothetical protein